MSTLKNIPTFATEAEEQQFWETHESTAYLDWSTASKATLPNLKPSTKTISLRLPEALLSSIKSKPTNATFPTNRSSKPSCPKMSKALAPPHKN